LNRWLAENASTCYAHPFAAAQQPNSIQRQLYLIPGEGDAWVHGKVFVLKFIYTIHPGSLSFYLNAPSSTLNHKSMKALSYLKGGLLLYLGLSGSFVIGQSSVGIRAGVMSSKQNVQDGNITEDYKSKLGADIAFVADFPIGIMSISPEFHWLQKGGKVEDLNGTLGEVSRTFNYLEIPLLLKLNFGKGAGFFLMAGPSVGYLLDGTDKDMDGHTNDIDLDFYKRTEWGAHVGGGIALGPIRIDLRYIFGLTDIFDDSSDIEITNTSLGAGVSFMF
jgi:hypothetical protein